MNSWDRKQLVRRLPRRVYTPVDVDGLMWRLLSVDASSQVMRRLEEMSSSDFWRVAHELWADAVVDSASLPGPCRSLVLIGDPAVGMRRAFVDPEGRPCALSYEAQQRVNDVLAAALAPTIGDVSAPVCTVPLGAPPLPITDGLLRLVLRELMTSGELAHEGDMAARLGLPHSRVLQVLCEASRRGLGAPVHAH